MASGYDEDELLIEGLPVGGMFGFVWNIISKYHRPFFFFFFLLRLVTLA